MTIFSVFAWACLAAILIISTIGIIQGLSDLYYDIKKGRIEIKIAKRKIEKLENKDNTK